MSSLRDRIEALPIIVPSIDDPEQKYVEEGRRNDAFFIASHSYLPMIGNVLMFSISGRREDKKRAIESLSKELGDKPLIVNKDFTGYWMVTWKSHSSKAPVTRIHLLLGRERFDEICSAFELIEEERGKVSEILGMILSFPDEYERQAAVRPILEDVDADRATKIVRAVEIIVGDYLNKAGSP